MHSGGGHWGGGHPVGVGGHPPPIRHPGPVFVGRPGHYHTRPVVVAAPFFYPYYYYYPYYPYYYPSAYPAPAYSESPTYVEQGPSILYYCPDYRDYYPNVATCPSPWLQVLPQGTGAYPN